MKKFVTTALIIGTGFALSACESTGSGDTTEYSTPYGQERTAGGHNKPAMKAKPAPVRAERVFREVQTK